MPIARYFFVFIADHGIEGVDRFIGHGQRRAAEEQEKSGAIMPSTVFSATVSTTARLICAGWS